MRNRKGFTMVELLVVLVIVAILAAVATPIYLANVKRSRASEAVSAMALIRQALRDYHLNANLYFDIASGDVQLPLPPSSDITAATGALANPAGVDVNAGVAQYFSNASYSVDSVLAAGEDGESGMFEDSAGAANAVDFIITADGDASELCGAAGVAATDCSVKTNEVATYRLEMDNSGRVFVCYDWDTAGAACDTAWASY